MAMRDRTTEHLDPYEPADAGYDWDYDEGAGGAPMPKILWGRVVVLAGILLVGFLLGRLTAPDGIPQSDLNAMEQQRDDARAQVAQLEDQVADLEAQVAQLEQPDDTTTGEETTEEPTTNEGEDIVGTEYEIQSGDSLSIISIREWDDADYADCLAALNNIDDPSAISVGDTIIIPKDPPSC
jgi:nucleoid-associated protein YgaU